MNCERSYKAGDLGAFKIGVQPAVLYDIITPFMDVPLKGGGSAYGGQWKPAKPEDKKFIGISGEVKQSFSKKRSI